MPYIKTMFNGLGDVTQADIDTLQKQLADLQAQLTQVQAQSAVLQAKINGALTASVSVNAPLPTANTASVANPPISASVTPTVTPTPQILGMNWYIPVAGAGVLLLLMKR